MTTTDNSSFITYRDSLKSEFASKGFVSPPLTDSQIDSCFTLDLSIDDAYEIGCDVNSGFCFGEAIEEAMRES